MTGGRTRRFTAVPAKRYGGLFKLRKRPGNRITGRSLGGSTLTLRVDQQSGRATGTLTRADGTRLRIDRRLHRHRSRFVEFRSVALNDGRMRGNKTTTSPTTSRNIVDPTCFP